MFLNSVQIGEWARCDWHSDTVEYSAPSHNIADILILFELEPRQEELKTLRINIAIEDLAIGFTLWHATRRERDEWLSEDTK